LRGNSFPLRLTGTLFRSYYGVREGDQGGVFRNFCFCFCFFVFCVRLGAERRLGIGDYFVCFIMGLWVWDFFLSWVWDFLICLVAEKGLDCEFSF